MTFRKISLTFLIIILGAACAHAKTKEPKYGQARQLTAEQAALVQKAVASEKVLIRSIRQRTPLVETYIQNTKPDIKLCGAGLRYLHTEPRRLRQGLRRQAF